MTTFPHGLKTVADVFPSMMTVRLKKHARSAIKASEAVTTPASARLINLGCIKRDYVTMIRSGMLILGGALMASRPAIKPSSGA